MKIRFFASKGGLDYLVINHASLSTLKKKNKSPFWDGDMDILHAEVTTNYNSYIQLASLALPLLHKTNGSLVIVGSLAGKNKLLFLTLNPVGMPNRMEFYSQAMGK